jgi:hypothetical protein
VTFAVNADFRYAEGYPTHRDVARYGIRAMRVTSLPEMEPLAASFLERGVQVLAIYTGESDRTGQYVMYHCSALQIGNEPFMDGAASWPTGSVDDFVNVWHHVANVLVPQKHAYLPLVGPGLWAQDYQRWAKVATRLPGLSAAAVHCYPEPSGQSVSSLKWYLARYRNVRPDLPLICTEWTSRTTTLEYQRAIASYCDELYWFTWGGGVGDYHKLDGSADLGTLSLA